MNSLKTNFGKRKIKVSKKTSLVQSLFTNVAKKYDLMNDVMSFGTHRIWKKILLEIIDIQMHEKIIDVGSGTGDIIKLILEKNKKNQIYCIDLNVECLKLIAHFFQPHFFYFFSIIHLFYSLIFLIPYQIWDFPINHQVFLLFF